VGYYTTNLGDNTQSLAIRNAYREIGIGDTDVVEIDRDTLASYAGEPAALVMNGVFFESCFPIPPSITPVFVGFHAKEKIVKSNADFFKRHEPIGCRDSATTELMLNHGISAFTTGCLTLTFPSRPTTPPRQKLLIVYGSGNGELPAEVLKYVPSSLADNSEFVFHRLAASSYPLSKSDRLRAEQYEADLLRRYRDQATIVLTSLHHVATPCIAMKVPVILCRRQIDDRFTYLRELLPIYTPDHFHQIDWNPLSLIIEEKKRELLNTLKRQIDRAHATTSIATQEMKPADLLSRARALIAELRNRRNPEQNWNAFKELIEGNRDKVLKTFSSRWLVSICDTYADYADATQRRNALLISLFVNMVRLSDSLFEDCDVRDQRVQAIKAGWPPFYDELHAMNLDKQDTCLNLAKRLIRSFLDDQLMGDIYRELLRRMKMNDNLVTRFSRRSSRPEWVFPEQPFGIEDNYGLV
jgi:hypothetical protein